MFEETIKHVLQSPAETGIDEMIDSVVLWLKLFDEVVAALLVGVGIGFAVVCLVRVFSKPTLGGYERARLLLARFLSIGLEFQLAADILGTTIAPSWTEIGKLGAIAVIRTGLNHFLALE